MTYGDPWAPFWFRDELPITVELFHYYSFFNYWGSFLTPVGLFGTIKYKILCL